MSSAANKLFGRLAVERGYCEDDQVQDALRVQEALAFQGRPLALGSILKNLGYLTEPKLEELLNLQKADASSDLLKREAALFGELLVENGFAPRSKVEEALRIQSSAPHKFKIGSILVSRNIITDEQRQVILKAIERIVRDAKRSKFIQAVPPGTKGARSKKRPFSGLFLFDPNAEDADEDEES